MNDIEVSSIDLVEGGNVFKQGHYLTLGYVPRDEKGETVDLSGKTLNVALWGRKGVVFEAAATYSGGVIRFTFDKLVAAGDYTVEFTATSSTDAKYRKKFPTNQHSGRIAIKQSADDLGVVGIQVYTVAQLKAEQKALLDAAVSGFTVDSETKMARVSGTTTHPTIGARLEADKQVLAAQLAEKKTKGIGAIAPADLSQETKEQMTGGSVAVVGTNSTGTKNIIRKSVTHDKLAYTPAPGIKSKNLFNKKDYTPNSDISSSTGELAPNTTAGYDFSVSGFIPVEPSTTYIKKSGDKVAYYDSDYKYISRELVKTFTTPANAFYIRVVFQQQNIDIYQVEVGSLETLYEPFAFYTDVSAIKNKSISKDKLAEEYISLQSGKNLFDKSKITPDHYISYSNGQAIPLANHSASGFTPVKPNTTHTKTDAQQFAFYDVNENYISGIASAGTFTTPSNAAFIRMTIKNVDVGAYQLEVGTVKTSYEPYGSYLSEGVISPATIEKFTSGKTSLDIKFQLPAEIDVVVGEEFNIYWRNVINYSQAFLNGNYYIRGQMKSGTTYTTLGEDVGYKWFYVPTTAGTFLMEFRIYDTYSQSIVDSQIVTFNAVSKALSAPKTANIKVIGDSFTDGYNIMGHLNTFLSESTGLTANFIGQNATDIPTVKDNAWSGYGYDWFYDKPTGYLRNDRPLSDAIWDAGWGENEEFGWTTGQTRDDLTTEQRSHGFTKNEFYNPATGLFDFAYHMQNYHPTYKPSGQTGEHLDAFVSFVGLNDSIWKPKAQLESEIPLYKTRIEHIANSVKAWDANTKVILHLVTVQNEVDEFMNTQGNDFRHSQRAKHSQEIWNQFILDTFDTAAWKTKGVYVMATNAHFDPKYGIRTKTINPVKFDNAVTQIVTNDVHPSPIGAKYMADVARNTILKRVYKP